MNGAKLSDGKSDEIIQKFSTLINDDLRKELEENIRSLADQVIQEKLQESLLGKRSELENNNNYKEYQKGHKYETGKVFEARNSLLTDLLEISHIRTLYHICIVILILLFLNTMIYDLVDRGSLDLGVASIFIAFGKINTVSSIWISMQFAALLPYVGLARWAKLRRKIEDSSAKTKALDVISLIIFLVYQLSFLALPISSVIRHDLAFGSSCIVLFEMVRFIMKSHAYVRSVSPRVLEKSKTSPTPLPSFTWYLYFLFAPTLVYRDTYPRTKSINWNRVVVRLLEVTAIIFYINFLCDRFLIRNWANFGSETEVLEAKQMVLILFGSMLPALLTFLCCFYLLLHCWHNATGEILTFADRRFYTDWWNQTDYGGYYRTWNVIVHDWLYTYIYRDIIKLSGSRAVGAFFVFLISAIVHEIIITFTFRFFYPVLLIMFGFFGVVLIFVTKKTSPKIGNILMWLTLAMGNGLLWCMYGAEFFARINCPNTVDNWFLDAMVPRSWFCHRIVFTPNWKFQNPFQL